MIDGRTALRRATAPEHERLDALFGAFELNDEAAYRAFLTAHAMAFAAVERALDDSGFDGQLADWPGRRRAAAIESDLRALGDAMPAPLPPPSLDTPAARWGAAYVLEGSRLGGAELARSVPEGMPRSYLGHAQPAGAWRAFVEHLKQALATPGDIADATRSARETFGLFEQAGRSVLGQSASGQSVSGVSA